MTVIRGHIIRLDPTDKQATYFAKACGVARLAYNWALAEWQTQYQADKAYRDDCLAKGIEIDITKLNKPSQGSLRKQLNAIKRTQFPFIISRFVAAPPHLRLEFGLTLKTFAHLRLAATCAPLPNPETIPSHDAPPNSAAYHGVHNLPKTPANH